MAANIVESEAAKATIANQHGPSEETPVDDGPVTGDIDNDTDMIDEPLIDGRRRSNPTHKRPRTLGPLSSTSTERTTAPTSTSATKSLET